MTARTIALAAAKGGVAKSTIASALAVQAVSEGARVALVDAEPQASLGLWWERRGEPDNPGMFTVDDDRGLGRAVAKLRAGPWDYVIVDTPACHDGPHRGSDPRRGCGADPCEGVHLRCGGNRAGHRSLQGLWQDLRIRAQPRRPKMEIASGDDRRVERLRSRAGRAASLQSGLCNRPYCGQDRGGDCGPCGCRAAQRSRPCGRRSKSSPPLRSRDGDAPWTISHQMSSP